MTLLYYIKLMSEEGPLTVLLISVLNYILIGLEKFALRYLCKYFGKVRPKGMNSLALPNFRDPRAFYIKVGKDREKKEKRKKKNTF